MAPITTALNILVVEDNPGDLFLLEELLRATDLTIGTIHSADRLSTARPIMERSPVDLVFLDLSLPDSFGLDSYTGLREWTQAVPVILMTGITDTSLALQALLLGAQDYLIKGDFDEKLLSRAIRYSMERLRSLRSLRESEERYRGLFNNNPMPMWIFDADTYCILEVNAAAIQHYGYSQDEFAEMTLDDLRKKDNREPFQDEIKQIAGYGDGIKKGVERHVRKNGELIYADVTWHNIRYKNKRAVLVLAGDVTERILLERELNMQRIMRQKQITEAVIQAQEKERSEIGKELHDNVNQILGASNLYINTAMTDTEMRDELLMKGSELVGRAINEIRKISKTLITPGLREIGLIDSIEDVIEDMKVGRSEGYIQLDIQNISEDMIEDRRKLTLFRIVQEQLNNIAKHARATEVLIRLSMEGPDIILTVSDNGVGFDASRHRKGVGITNMISRAELFNGKVDIHSVLGDGCVLTVNLPA